MAKPKVALYWATSCGGCEVTVVDLHEKIIDVKEAVDIVFWPCVMDAKYKDVEAMEDKSIDLCLFNGGIRNSEQEEVAHLLRRKSKALVAFGACAHMGGIPGLANDKSRQAILDRSYLETESTQNPEKTLPQTSFKVEEGDLRLPEFYDRVYPLDRIVPVEYYVPGCPPTPDNVWAVLVAVLEGKLPAPGSVVGAGNKTCCDECKMVREEKKVKSFTRYYKIRPEPEKCLLEQGIVCAGPATRSGCGGQCTSVGMPCRGCYGPAEGVIDQGAKLLSAIASVIDSNDEEEIRKIIDEIDDPVGYMWRFSLPHSLLGGAKSSLPEQHRPAFEEEKAAAGASE
jgi:F420-non-reducing hydrogenase small subunit